MFNIFILVGLAIMAGLALSIFVSRQKPPGDLPPVPPEDDALHDNPEARSLGLQDLEAIADHLCQENRLLIKEKILNDPSETYWITESKNEFFFGLYVMGFIVTSPSRQYVLMHDVLEFKDFIKSVGSQKGFLFTTGYFTKDVHQPLEGPKVTLYNRRMVLDELARMGKI